MVNSKRWLRSESIIDLGLHNSSRYIDLVSRSGEVEVVEPAIIAGGLSPDRVAYGLERIHGVELGEDVVEEEGHLLLLGEAVEGAWLEVVEGIVCGGQEGETLV